MFIPFVCLFVRPFVRSPPPAPPLPSVFTFFSTRSLYLTERDKRVGYNPASHCPSFTFTTTTSESEDRRGVNSRTNRRTTVDDFYDDEKSRRRVTLRRRRRYPQRIHRDIIERRYTWFLPFSFHLLYTLYSFLFLSLFFFFVSFLPLFTYPYHRIYIYIFKHPCFSFVQTRFNEVSV